MALCPQMPTACTAAQVDQRTAQLSLVVAFGGRGARPAAAEGNGSLTRAAGTAARKTEAQMETTATWRGDTMADNGQIQHGNENGNGRLYRVCS